MTKILELGLFDGHVAQLREIYRQKLAAMLAAATEFLLPFEEVQWTEPNGGLYVWLELPKSIDAGPTGPLLQLAMEKGVFYVPGKYCYANEGDPTKHNAIRLSFGVQDGESIRQGVRLLASSLADVIKRNTV